MQPQEMLTAMEADPGLKEKMQADPVRTLETLAALPLRNDRWIYRAIVVGLIAISVCAVMGGIVLTFYGKTMPAEISTIAGGAVGAMAGLLKLTGD